jgi:hypothetical protein
MKRECHEWHCVADIGEWIVGFGENLVQPVPVQQQAATAGDFWSSIRIEAPGCCAPKGQSDTPTDCRSITETPEFRTALSQLARICPD